MGRSRQGNGNNTLFPLFPFLSCSLSSPPLSFPNFFFPSLFSSLCVFLSLLAFIISLCPCLLRIDSIHFTVLLHVMCLHTVCDAFSQIGYYWVGYPTQHTIRVEPYHGPSSIVSPSPSSASSSMNKSSVALSAASSSVAASSGNLNRSPTSPSNSTMFKTSQPLPSDAASTNISSVGGGSEGTSLVFVPFGRTAVFFVCGCYYMTHAHPL